jgi:cell division protein ZapA (FtsZ GTPase activity inhibitor)
METTELLQVNIAGRSYPLKALKKNVDHIKETALKVNAVIKDLTQKYDGRDMQDYLAMYVLLMMTDTISLDDTAKMEDIKVKLAALNKNLDNLLE